MKRVIRIDRTSGEVTVEADPMLGVVLAMEVDTGTGMLSLSFQLSPADARKLGEALSAAAADLDPGDREPVSYPRLVERREDMSPLGRLRLILQEDGDVVVACVPDPDGSDAVEFCTPFMGGGRSPNTLHALRKLAEAMEQDNRENPIAGG